ALQGASFGTAYGRFDIEASSDHGTTNVKIDVPTLHIDLPEASTHSVQDLDEAPPQTNVGVYASPGKFVLLPLSGPKTRPKLHGAQKPSNPLTVDMHFGKVEVQRGPKLKVDLDGNLTAKMD